MRKSIIFCIGFLILLVFVVLYKKQNIVNHQSQIANPASLYCEEQGYKLEIRTDVEGNQFGVCIFSDGSECEEWAFYRKECKPGENYQ